jgi:hypothetical protein
VRMQSLECGDNSLRGSSFSPGKDSNQRAFRFQEPAPIIRGHLTHPHLIPDNRTILALAVRAKAGD